MLNNDLNKAHQPGRSIAEPSTKDSIGVWIAALGLNGAFAGFVYGAWERTATGELSTIAAQVSAISTGVFVIGAFVHALLRLRDMPRWAWIWLLATTPVAIQMLVQGFFVNPNGDIPGTGLDSLPWAALPLVPVLACHGMPRMLDAVLKLHALLGTVNITIILLMRSDLVTADVVKRSETIEFVQSLGPSYSVFYVFLCLPRLGWFMRAAAIIGFAEYGMIGGLTGTRQSVVLFAMIAFMGVFIVFRSLTEHGVLRLKAGRQVGLGIVLVGMLGLGVLYYLTRMEGGVQLLTTRFMYAAGPSSIAENLRWEEARCLIEQFEGRDYLLGRGVIGEFENYYGVPGNVHIGYLRIMLKGGVPLVLLVLAGPVLAGVRAMMRSRDPRVLAAAGVCLWFGAKTLVGNVALQYNASWLVVLLCFGACQAWLQSRKAHSGARAKVRLLP